MPTFIISDEWVMKKNSKLYYPKSTPYEEKVKTTSSYQIGSGNSKQSQKFHCIL